MVADVPKVAQLPQLSEHERRAAAKASSQRNDGRPMLSIEDTAAYLKVSRDTVYRIIRGGKLQSFRIEGSLRIRPSDIDAYVEQHVAS